MTKKHTPPNPHEWGETMDPQAHLETYYSFMKFLAGAAVVVVILLAALAWFLV